MKRLFLIALLLLAAVRGATGVVPAAAQENKIDLTLKEADGRYWGSFYRSVGYQLPEGATAYTMDETHQLNRLGTDGRTIPANTAVVILSEKKSITLDYTTDTEGATIHGYNILQGSVDPVSLTDGKVGGGTPYVLGMVEEELGLYKYTGSQIPAGKAYYVEGDVVYLSALTEDYTAQDRQTLVGKLARSVKISIAANAVVTLQDVDINGDGKFNGSFAGITCLGKAVIKLKGTNKVKSFGDGYPGIQAAYSENAEEDVLTLYGSGELTATGRERGAGIGGGSNAKCGSILIVSGTISANGGYGAAGIGSGSSVPGWENYIHTNTGCGHITINGGTITAKGGDGKNSDGTIFFSIGVGGNNRSNIYWYYSGGAGIGSGAVATCGDITINGGTVSVDGTNAGIGSGGGGSFSNGLYVDPDKKYSYCGAINIKESVTRVSAKTMMGINAIGRSTSDKSFCDRVKIGNTEYWYNGAYQNGGETYLTQKTLVYEPSH